MKTETNKELAEIAAPISVWTLIATHFYLKEFLEDSMITMPALAVHYTRKRTNQCCVEAFITLCPHCYVEINFSPEPAS